MIKKLMIHHSIVYDFIMSQVRIINEKSPFGFYKNKEELDSKFKLDENISKWLKKTRKIIPKNKLSTMELFFNVDTIVYKTFIFYTRYKDFSTVEEFIEYMEKISPDDFLSKYIFIRSKYSKQIKDIKESQAKKIIENSDSIMQFIEKTNFSPNRKWEFLQVCLEKDKWYKKLLDLFVWYNENIFQKEIKRIEKIVSRQENELKFKITKYGNEYLNLLLNIDYENESTEKTLVFTVSYFQELGYVIYLIGNHLEDLYVFGFRHMELFVERKHGLLSNVYLFKALGDETRQNMIKLLSKKEWYGDELAQTMNLSNSTVSYHLNILIIEGFVKVKRVENRSYFRLKKEQLLTTVQSAVERMFENTNPEGNKFKIED